MRIAIFQDLHDRRLMSEEKCIESLTFSLLITKSHHFQKSDNIWALQSVFRIYTVSSEASFSWVDTSTLMVINWKLTFKCRSKKFSEQSIARAIRLFFESHFLAIFIKIICHKNFEIGTQDLRGEFHILILLIQLATFHKSPIS